jgi:hypothetical protein
MTMASLLNFGPAGRRSGLLGYVGKEIGGAPRNDVNLLEGLGQAITDNPLTLTALGAGIAQGGIGRGLQFALPALQADEEQQRRDQTRDATYRALRLAGLPSGEALVGSLHPEILKGIAKTRFVSPPLPGSVRVNDLEPTNTDVNASVNSSITSGEHLDWAPKYADRDSSVDLRAVREAAPFNRVIGHLSDIMTISKIGKIDNVRAIGPDPRKTYDAKRYRDVTGDKIANLFQAAGINDIDTKRWNEALRSTNSMADVRPVVKGAIQLITSRLNALNEEYHNSKGRSGLQMLSPKAQAMLSRLENWSNE